jgi:hypothetical protein
MIGSRRRGFPFVIPLLAAVALGYLLAGGLGSVIGALLFLPLLIMKVLFVMFVFGVLLRFAGGGRHWGHHRAGYNRHRSTKSTDEPETDEPEEERDWEEALRAAKREIDKLFPNPRE